VANLEDDDFQKTVINRINDSVFAFAKPIFVLDAELFAASWAGILYKAHDTADDLATYFPV
jgi:hypothetical protein